MRTDKRKFLFAALMALGVAVSGCSNEGDDSVTNPNAGELRPTGTIQGNLVDAVTQQPIQGAVIDIGVGKGTTTSTGQYKIENVPATQDALNGTVTGTYTVTIDMRNVTSPVNMTKVADTGKCYKAGESTTAANETACYPQFSYNMAMVEYTSLNDTDSGAGEAGTTTGSNHDTPVTGLVTTASFTAGKLDANITGLVIDMTVDAVGNTVYAPVAGAEVNLYSTGSMNSGNAGGADGEGSGAARHLVSTFGPTGADGSFTFSNIEAFQGFVIEASASGSVLFGAKGVTAPADEQTLKLDNLQANPAAACSGFASLNPCFPVVVNTQDANPPFIKSVNLENGADLDPTDVPLHVIYTFSEAIAKTAYSAPEFADDAATTEVEVASANGVANLADALQVNFLGTKAGNIAHSIYWNAAMTELHVEIPALAASSAYNVTVAGALGNLLDSTGNSTLDPNGLASVSFTTNGGNTAAAPAITITNSASLQTIIQSPTAGGGTAIVDWIPVSGAKGYNVYVATDEIWGATTQAGQYALVATVNPSQASVPVGFVEDAGIKLVNRIKVRSVNSDGVESADSNVVTAQDNVGASINNAPPFNTAQIAGLALPADGGSDTDGSITVFFNEFVNEAAAETIANYTIALDTAFIAANDGGADVNAIDTAAGRLVQCTELVPAITAVSQLGETTQSVTLTLSITNPTGTVACDLNGDGDTADPGEAAQAHIYNGLSMLTIGAGLTDVAGNAPASSGNVYHNADDSVN